MASHDQRALVRHERDEGVHTLVLERAERHNALVPELLDDLRAAVAAVHVDDAAEAVVLAAAGPSFSTGGDVAAFAAHDDHERVAYAREIVGRLNEVVLALLDLPQPVVASVHGPVTGGSLGLVLAADVVVVGPRAWFAPWYVDVGFSPDGGWTALLPERIGRSRAAAIQLTNARIGAHDALAWGLATHLVDDPGATAAELAREIADKVTGSVRSTLRLLAPDRAAVAAALDRELEAFVAQVATPEATAGMAAFLGS